MSIEEDSLRMHKKLRGKISIASKLRVRNKASMVLTYTPGVAAPVEAIHKNKERAYDYTIKPNCVAIVTDGSSVLGLGNVGPLAALPVMEGKALLMKELAGIDAFPLCLDTHDKEEIIKTVRYIAPAFGAINLEDIAAPNCFEIETRLQDLGIPVLHDDQHATAVVALAGLMNAAKVVKKRMGEMRVAISGAGAAGTAIAKMLLCTDISETHERAVCEPVKDVIICDTKGMIHAGRTDLNDAKKELARITNVSRRSGTLADAMKGADVFIGVSVGGIVTKEMVASMNKGAIVFALANPTPEIMPRDALAAGAAIAASGRSDYPNQINNVLAFPAILRGALDARASRITPVMLLTAAKTIAASVKRPTAKNIVPDPTDRKMVKRVAAAVREAWSNT